MSAPHRRSVRSLAVVLIVGLAVGACGGAGAADPSDAVADAFRRTFEGPFAFELSLDVEGAALAEMSEDAAPELLESLRVSGRVAEESFALEIGAAGSELFEVRLPADGTLYFRVALAAMSELSGEDAPDVASFLSLLESAPVDDSFRAWLAAAAAGDWVGLSFPEDPSALGGAPIDPEEIERVKEDFEERFGDAGTFVDTYLTVEDAGDGRYELTVRARDLARDLSAFAQEANASGGLDPADLAADVEDIPETIGGITVVVSGDVVTSIELDALEIARQAGEEEVPDGRFDVVLRLFDHGSVAAIEAPEGAEVLSIEDLLQLAMTAVFGGLGDLGELGDSGSASAGLGAGDAQVTASLLAAAQISHRVETGAYADDVLALLGGSIPTAEAYGTCAFAGGEHFVVAAESAGEVWYLDSSLGAPTQDPSALGCEPVLITP